MVSEWVKDRRDRRPSWGGFGALSQNIILFTMIITRLTVMNQKYYG